MAFVGFRAHQTTYAQAACSSCPAANRLILLADAIPLASVFSFLIRLLPVRAAATARMTAPRMDMCRLCSTALR